MANKGQEALDKLQSLEVELFGEPKGSIVQINESLRSLQSRIQALEECRGIGAEKFFAWYEGLPEDLKADGEDNQFILAIAELLGYTVTIEADLARSEGDVHKAIASNNAGIGNAKRRIMEEEITVEGATKANEEAEGHLAHIVSRRALISNPGSSELQSEEESVDEVDDS